MCIENDQNGMNELRKEVAVYLAEETVEIESGENWIPNLEENGKDVMDFFTDLVDKINELEISEQECRIILDSDNFLEFALEVWRDCPDLSMLSLLEIIFVRAEEVLECAY